LVSIPASAQQEVYTNDDLPPALPESSRARTAEPPPDVPLLSYDDLRDINGHGEGWWRQRATLLDIAIDEAEEEVLRLEVQYQRGKKLANPYLSELALAAKERLLGLMAERDGLPEELRKAGGPAGWLRRPSRDHSGKALPAPSPGNARYEEGLILEWPPVPEAHFYFVEMQCLDCINVIYESEILSTDVVRPRARFPLSEGRRVRWRVQALDNWGLAGPWSPWLTSTLPGVESP
jgi:hypothetical protein